MLMFSSILPTYCSSVLNNYHHRHPFSILSILHRCSANTAVKLGTSRPGAVLLFMILTRTGKPARSAKLNVSSARYMKRERLETLLSSPT